MSADSYLGNPNLKKVGTPIEFTEEQIKEYLKCKEDPVYFAMNYVKIISLDEGVVPFKMWDFQKKPSRTSTITDLISPNCHDRLVSLPPVCHTYFTMRCSMTT